MSAVKRYPVASIESAREREIENCANSKTAVIRSVTKTIASSAGKNMFSAPSGLPEKKALNSYESYEHKCRHGDG